MKSSNPHITAKAVETGRNYGQVSYALEGPRRQDDARRLSERSPDAGDQRRHGQQIPVLVEGRVTPGITVSPAALFMGVVQPGQKVTKQLVVKSKKPFRILGDHLRRQVVPVRHARRKTPSKELHLIPVTFTAGTDAGKVVKTIKIKTDQGEMTPELAAYAVVAATK